MSCSSWGQPFGWCWAELQASVGWSCEWSLPHSVLGWSWRCTHWQRLPSGTDSQNGPQCHRDREWRPQSLWSWMPAWSHWRRSRQRDRWSSWRVKGPVSAAQRGTWPLFAASDTRGRKNKKRDYDLSSRWVRKTGALGIYNFQHKLHRHWKVVLGELKEGGRLAVETPLRVIVGLDGTEKELVLTEDVRNLQINKNKAF